jgi:peptide deformylase
MALLSILHHPDPRLRRKAALVTRFDDELRALIEDLFETMYAAPGTGLAANQVGMSMRLAVMDCSETRSQRIVMINPEIISSDERREMEEGCLSVPDIFDKVQRYNRLHLRALNEFGEPFEVCAFGLMAQCIQHEIDHLDGKLYIDYLSPLKRERIKKKLLKREAA